MRILIAPDSYKGSLSALKAARAMKKGMLEVFPEAEIVLAPIADGGEGTVEALVAATGGTVVRESVSGPLGSSIESFWGILGDGRTAVIEMAAASGLPLVPEADRNPMVTSSHGTGELIKSALDRGFKKIIIGIGGSATNDGGAGMARALGVKFLDSKGKELPEGGGALADLAQIDLSGIDPRIETTDIIVACDVDNPLCGPRGASAVYGPQKGATVEIVKLLDAALHNFGKVASMVTGKDVAALPGAGAAGGLGAGLMFFTPAILRSGVDIIFEELGLASRIQKADLVITGEGKTDFQTAFGKAPAGVGDLAAHFGKVALCISGSLGNGAEEVFNHGLQAVVSIVPRPMTLNECMESAEVLVEQAANRLARILKAGMLLKGVRD
jgi:glycerate 2-kinase